MTRNRPLAALLEELRQAIEEIEEDRARTGLGPLGELGRTVRLRRKQQRMTLQELSLLVDLSPTTLRKIEQGSKSVSLERVERVTQALGMSLWIG